jgi:Zn-dependent membrane protease YugP
VHPLSSRRERGRISLFIDASHITSISAILCCEQYVWDQTVLLAQSLPLVALLHVKVLFNFVAVTIAVRVQSWFDRKIPDDLEMTAGDWLRTELDKIIGEDASIVTSNSSSSDGYHSNARIIELTDKTYFKSDPVFWATAAHELGHARLRHRHPWTKFASSATFVLSTIFSRVAMGLAAAYFLYAQQRVLNASLLFFGAALALYLFRLFDELYANVFAFRVLRRESKLQPEHRRAVAWSLATFFLTYAADFASLAILLSQWRLFADFAGTGMLDWPLRLTTIGHVVLLSSIVALVLANALAVAKIRAANVMLLRLTSWIVVVFLAWNLDSSLAWKSSIMWTLTCDGHLIVRLLIFSVTFPIVTLLYRARRWVQPSFHETAGFRAARQRGLHLVTSGNACKAKMSAVSCDPLPRHRLISSFRLLVLIPLLIEIWQRYS